MSEQKQERTIEVVHQDYSRLCSQAGHIQYQISALTSDLNLVNAQLKDLNLEAAGLAAKAKEAEAKPEDKKE